MDELLSRKLGEIRAFASLGIELLNRAKPSDKDAFGEEMAAELRRQLSEQIEFVKVRVNKVALDKAESTTAKLRGMMEVYVGDAWGNPVELLEWSGFYLGAASVHWSLVVSLASSIDSELATFAQEQAKQFDTWLANVRDIIKTKV